MPQLKSSPRTCDKGHIFYKSSNCPVCPVCEAGKPINYTLWIGLAAPARRALASKGITNVNILSQFTEEEILALHGMGKSSIPLLKKALVIAGKDFRKKSDSIK